LVNALLWVLQLLLAAAYFAHGWLLLSPPPDVEALLRASIPDGLRYFIGVAEVAAAAGMILPGVTGILPWLVPTAAAGLIPIMIGATVLHLSRAEYSSAVTTTVLLLLVTLLAYMRWKVLPIRPRTRRPVGG